MSEQNPYETLGVTKESSFEDIQQAKQQLSGQISDDRQKVATIEAAYDAIIMERLKMRQEGKLNVPEDVRFPERQTPPPKTNPGSGGASARWVQQFVDTPNRTEILVPTVLFGSLGVVTLFVESAQSQAFSTILAVGFIIAVYWLTRKENRLGRAILLTFGALLISTLIATVVVNLGAIPVANGGLSSSQLATLVNLLIFWILSAFIR